MSRSGYLSSAPVQCNHSLSRMTASCGRSSRSASASMDSHWPLSWQPDGLRGLSPVTLLEHLSDPLRLLRDGPRDLPSRQQTMRNAIAWSYDLLAPEEQALFRRLAVFVDGFDLEAAHAITGDPAIDVVDRIGALVEQNLLRLIERAGEGQRFALFETVREFAWQQIQEQGETEEVCRKHAEYYLDLAERMAATIYSSEMRHCLDRLEVEYPNYRAALTFFIDTGRVNQELRLAAMLSEFGVIAVRFRKGSLR